MAEEEAEGRSGSGLGLLRERRHRAHRACADVAGLSRERDAPHQLRGRRRPWLEDQRARRPPRETARAAGRSSSCPARPAGPNTGRRCWPPCRRTARWSWSTAPASPPASRRPASPTSACRRWRSAPLLDAAPGQKILLVGQSYGAAIATVMAAKHPKSLAGVVLLSSFLGDTGPTARWLVDLGMRVLSLIPRDLRHAILEVSGQSAQLMHMRAGAAAAARAGARDPRRRRRLRADRAGASGWSSETRSRGPIRFVRVPGAEPLHERRPGRGADERAGVLCARARAGQGPRSSCRRFPGVAGLAELRVARSQAGADRQRRSRLAERPDVRPPRGYAPPRFGGA